MLTLFRAIAFLTLFGFCLGKIAISPRIIGGEYVKIADFPWQLSLKHEYSHICGASVLSARRALTAAHCFDSEEDQEDYTDNYTVTAGSIMMKQLNVNKNIRVTKYITHPHFDIDTCRADIAVMWLERDLVFSPSVQPVRLPNQNEVVVHGATAYVAGWGCTSDNYYQENSRKLRAIAINVISNKRCNIIYEGIVRSDMLCASGKNYDKDARFGDSGGALVIGDAQSPTQIGVVSWGKQSTFQKYPGVYTRVASYTNWIKSVV